MTDDREPPRFHQDDIAAIGKEAARLLAQSLIVPHPSPPSGTMTGADLRSIQQFDPDISALERYVSMILTAKLATFMTKEQIAEFLANKTAGFLTKEQIRAEARDVSHEDLEAIGLPMATPEEKRATAEALRSTIKWQRRIEVAGNTVIGGLVLTAFYALMKLMGIKLPNPPGMGG